MDYRNLNSHPAIRSFLSVDDNPISADEYWVFWKSLSEDEKDYYRTVPLFTVFPKHEEKRCVEDVARFFNDGERRISVNEFMKFWNSLSREDQHYYLTAEIG